MLASRMPDELFMWICENIHREYRNIDDISTAYDYLSRADLFRARIIRRQSWNLQKYMTDMFVYGLSAKRRVSITNYSPPQRQKRIDAALLDKIGKKLHVSRKGAAAYIGVVKNFAGDEDFCRDFDFDEDDIETLRSLE